MLRILLLALTGLTLSACWPDEDVASEEGTTIRTVRTEIATVADPVVMRSFPAVLEPPQITPLAFDVGGRLGPVRLQIGQAVAEGDVLATVEAADADLRLRQAEAALAEAEARAVEDQSSMGCIISYKSLLPPPVFRHVARRTSGSIRMERHAPTPTPDAIVRLDQPGEVGPCILAQRLCCKWFVCHVVFATINGSVLRADLLRPA